jgi:hypothetical protein
MLFIGLNPSTADEERDDPTVNRCIDFARTWGYGGMYIANLFAFRSKDPKEMMKAQDPIGPENDAWLEKLSKSAPLIVAAWGNEGGHRQRSSAVRRMIPHLHCLSVNDNGEPGHLLYLPANNRPRPMPQCHGEYLDEALVEAYVSGFYGFGRWDAKVWFVGVEEAGGCRKEEVQKRLGGWNYCGRNEIEDAPIFYPLCGNSSWHGDRAIVQATWGQLIGMLLLARGQDDSEDAILDYQCSTFGSTTGETCLAELLPLPSPNTGDWKYAEWSTLPWLKSRAAYFSAIAPLREKELKRRIEMHSPQVVIFYGLELPGGISLLPKWSSIAGGWFHQGLSDKKLLLWRESGKTAYFVTRHPVAESDECFREIGRHLRDTHGHRF